MVGSVDKADSQATHVELVKLWRVFNQVVAVEDVSLTIRRGEFFSLLGPSGCGKTTTLRMIGGFEEPTSGEIILQGARIDHLPPDRRPTNMVFQQLALFPHLTVSENIAFGLRLKRQPARMIRKRVDDALSLVDLGGYGARFPNQISGGQQQRVAIARALVNEPAVLLLDEPLAALDLRLRLQMQTELKALQHRVGTTFIFVTHDQGEAFAMSDRVALMNKGRIEQLGRPRDLYERPASRFAAEFVGDTNLLEGTVAGVSGDQTLIRAAGIEVAAPKTPFRAGEPVAVSLRPECIDILAAPAPGSHPAIVRSGVFQGATLKLTVELASGQVLQALALDRGELGGLSVGSTVHVAIDPRRVVVLPK
jgi:spermidine/putrescine transport system ATP-binding protein